MDETLTNYRSEVKKYGELLGSYQKVCQRLVKNFCQDCPDIREFRKYHLSIDLKAAEIEDIEASISQFNPFIESIRAREGDAACTTQIVSAIKDSKGTKDGIAERFSHTKCQP